MTPYRDMSLFQGWMDYYDDDGQRWRRESDDPFYKFYKFVDDAFFYDGKIFKHSNYGIKKTHDAYIAQTEDTDED